MGLNGLNREKPAQLKLFLGIMRTFGRTFCENAKCCHDAQSPKLLGANSKKTVGFHPKKTGYILDAACMEYLPTFGSFLG